MFGWHLRELGNKPICESGHAGCFHYFPSVVLDFRVRGRLPRDRLLGQQPSASRTQRERKTLRLQTYTYTYTHSAMYARQPVVCFGVCWVVCVRVMRERSTPGTESGRARRSSRAKGVAVLPGTGKPPPAAAAGWHRLLPDHRRRRRCLILTLWVYITTTIMIYLRSD